MQVDIEVSCPGCGHVQPSTVEHEPMEDLPVIKALGKMMGSRVKSYAFHGSTTCLKCSRKYVIMLTVSSLEDE